MTFVEIEITHRTDTQMRVEFECEFRVVITDERQIPPTSVRISARPFDFIHKRTEDHLIRGKLGEWPGCLHTNTKP